MISIYDSSTYSVLSPSSLSYKHISGSIPSNLSPGGGLPLDLYVEDFKAFICLLMDLTILFFYFSTQVNFNRTSYSNINMPRLIKSW